MVGFVAAVLIGGCSTGAARDDDGRGGSTGGGAAGTGGGADCGGGDVSGSAGSLNVNGGFECPTVPPGGLITRAAGSALLPGWLVTGAGLGRLSVLSGTYVNDGFSWPAHGGAQTLNLIGEGTQGASVWQEVATTPGTTYHLSFWVGNLVAPSTWGTTSTVLVFIDNTLVLTAVNGDGAGTTALAWKQFMLDFTAAKSATTIEFWSGDPSGDSSNILDDVVLTP